MELDVLRKRAARIPSAPVGSANKLDNELRLIPNLNFNCSGRLISLLLGVDIRTMTNTRNEYPEVQIYRPPNHGYRRRDSMKIQIAAGNFSPDGVLVYDLPRPMSFRSGDVLGVYQPQQNASVVRLYYSVNDTAPDMIQIRDIGDNLKKFLFRKSTGGVSVTGQNILLSPITGTTHNSMGNAMYNVKCPLCCSNCNLKIIT